MLQVQLCSRGVLCRPVQADPTRSHVACRPNFRTKAVAVAEEAVVSQLEAAVRPSGQFFPPVVTDEPERLMKQNEQPFLTKQAGRLPCKPENLYDALCIYGNYSSRYVSVRVANAHVKLQSWEHAVETLADADEARKPYWCSLVEKLEHPDWWPAEGHVPTYDQVIFGRGNASIGLHYDKDNECAGGSKNPVSTYLAICEGAKLVLLLPPDQTLLPAGGDPDLLLNPTQQFLDDVKAAGGYFFVLEDLPHSNNYHNGSNHSSFRYHDRHDFSATALYMPAGWYHWLVGLTDWHMVYGGSFYPKQQTWLQQQS